MDEWKRMKRGSVLYSFPLHFFFWLVILFFFFYFESNPIAERIDHLQRGLLMKTLSILLGPDRIVGTDILAHPHFRIYITRACNGLIPFYLYLAAILAYPSPWKKRLIWGVLGYGIFFFLNVLRLLFVTQMVGYDPSNFHWAHDIVGNAILLLGGLSLFALFLRSKPYARTHS